MSNESSPLEKWNVAGTAQHNIYTDNKGPIIPGNQGTINLNYIAPTALDKNAVPNNTPRKGARHFIGRTKDIQHLHDHLQKSSQFAITALTGMGGIGKTELALQYIRTYWEETYPGGVCWLESRDQDIATQILNFSAAYLNLHPSEDLSLEARIAYCWNNWASLSATNTSERALIVIDDVTSYDVIAPYLPPISSRFTLLITTRLQNLAANIPSLKIDVLDELDALDLLNKLAGKKHIEADLAQAKSLCQWLGYLPLALELVGLYLARKSNLSLSKLQAQLEDQELNARALAKTQPGRTNLLGVASAFELSWKDIESEAAKGLAYRLSLLGSSPIPWQLLESCLPDQNSETLYLLEEDRDDWLVNFHLLNDLGENTYQLHQLVREFLRKKSNETDRDRKIERSVVNNLALLSAHIPEDVTQKDLWELSYLIPHLEEAKDNLSNLVSEENFIFLFQGIGRFYDGQGRYDLSREISEDFKRKSENIFGSKHSNTLRASHALSISHYNRGNYESAETLQREIIAEKIFVSKSISTSINLFRAETLNSLGLSLVARGRYDEAESLYKHSLDIREKILGSKHPDIADSFNNIALLYESKGFHKEAENLFIASLDIRKTSLGDHHPRVATSLNNLASCYHHQERFEEAEKLYFQALNLYKRLHGNEHRDIAKTLNNLAQAFENQGKYANAEPCFLEALKIQEKILGSRHPEIATLLNNIAGLYEDLGDVSKAERYYYKSLEIKRELRGSEHYSVGITMNNLAKLYQNNHRYTESKSLYSDAIRILKISFQEDHPILVKVRKNLESLYPLLKEKDLEGDA